jgi:hypothetical protein
MIDFKITTDLEQWSTMGLIGVDMQIYDLTNVTDFVAEIAEAADEADAPLFNAGLIPADKCIILLSGYKNESSYIALHMQREANDKIRCSTMHVLAHNHVTSMMIETADKVKVMLNNGTLPKHLKPTVDYLEQNEWLNPNNPENQIRPDEIFEIGSIAHKEASVSWAMGRMASAACEFMAMPIVAREPAALQRSARRRLERLGVRVSLTNVNLTRSIEACRRRGTESNDIGDSGRALHFVSGHWRVSPSSIHARMVHGQMKIWIDGFWRGDPEHGVVLHRYLARKKEAKDVVL